MRRILLRLGLLLLIICRGIYCFIFFTFASCGVFVVSAEFLKMARTHSFDGSDVFAWTLMGIYTIVLGIAWWTIFRDKPVSKQWAIAANLIAVNPHVPALLISWRWQFWQNFLQTERDWWPITVFGVVGVIIFSLPYHHWQNKRHSPNQDDPTSAISNPSATP